MRGNIKLNRELFSGSLVTMMSPPIPRARPRLIARPSPVPSCDWVSERPAKAYVLANTDTPTRRHLKIRHFCLPGTKAPHQRAASPRDLLPGWNSDDRARPRDPYLQKQSDRAADSLRHSVAPACHSSQRKTRAADSHTRVPSDVRAHFGQPARLGFLPWEEWLHTVTEEEAAATWDHIAHSPRKTTLVRVARRACRRRQRRRSCRPVERQAVV